MTAADRLWAALEALRRTHPHARWTPPEMLHLTLVFLGGTDPASVPAIESAVRTVVAQHGRFVVTTSGADGRTDARRAGVAWLRVDSGRQALVRLARGLDRAIGSGAYARSAPRPHLTVARKVDQRLLDDLRAATMAGLSASFELADVVLFRSHTGPHGSRYEELARHVLTRPVETA